MIKFNEYKIINEASKKGADTAYSGHANEHFTNQLLKTYVKHYGKSAAKGIDDETAHQAAMNHITKKKYDEKDYSDIPELRNASAHFGHDEMSRMHEDSKKTVTSILNHLRNNYKTNIADSMHVGKGGSKAVEKETGQRSEADLLLKTKNSQGKDDEARAYLAHLGASLKYSKGAPSSIKIHSPTVNKMAHIVDSHYQQMHGKSSGIHKDLDTIGKEGVAAQQAILAKHHNVLANYFNKTKDPKLTYTPIVDKHGNISGGNLSQDAVSHIRDSDNPKLRAAYDDMGKENLKMKAKMAAVFHKHVSAVLDHKPGDPAHRDLKESLLRSMGNMHTDKLPTFLVSTKRDKPEADIYDVGKYFTNHIAENGVEGHNYTGKTGFNAGPMDISLDTRPTTSKNPVTSFPINTTVKSGDMIKEGPTEVSPKRSKKTAASVVAPKKPAKSSSQENAMTNEGGREPPIKSSNEMFGQKFHSDDERNV